MIISIMRQLVVLIPVAWLLAKTGNVTFVWWAFPAAEIVSCFFSVLFFKKVYQNITLEIG